MRFIEKWQKRNKNTFRLILLGFVLWQLLVTAVIGLGVRFLPETGGYLYLERVIINPRWLWSRANFDGLHYLGIAKSGYGLYQQAFFPLYPSLIRHLTPFFGGRDLLTGLLISNFSLLLALFFLYRLVRLDYSERVARRTLFYLLIFPTAFFFSLVYTESLFLLLIVTSFYFARIKKWWWAGIFGAFASATRIVGVFLLPALAIELWQQRGVNQEIKQSSKQAKLLNSSIAQWLFIFLIPLGLLYYMRFLQANFGDSLLFFKVQPYFGAERTGGRLVLLYQVFWRYLKMVVTVEKQTPTYFVVLLELGSGVAFLGLTIFAYLRRWFSYVTFMALAYIAPTLTGTFSSLPRYVLVLFPGFILLSLWTEKYRWIKMVYSIVCGTLLIVSLVLFSRGFWIA